MRPPRIARLFGQTPEFSTRTFTSTNKSWSPRRLEPKGPNVPPPPPPPRFGVYSAIVEPKGRKSNVVPPIIPSSILLPDYAQNETGRPELSGTIDLKSEEDLKLMRNATTLAAKALKVAESMIKPGITTEDIDRGVFDTIIEGGGWVKTQY